MIFVCLFLVDRPNTPDFSHAVYCLVGIKFHSKFPDDLSRAELSIHGTCFAFSPRHLLTAFHNIKDNKLTDIGISKTIYKSAKIDPHGFFRVTSSRHDLLEDWAILEPIDPNVTMSFLNIFTDSANLPEQGNYVVIHDFPVGILTEGAVGKLVCDRKRSSIYSYEPLNSQKRKVKASNKFTLAQPTNSDIKTEVVTLKTGRSVGSCGAPYCLWDGSVLAFHTYSLDDSEENQSSGSHRSHTSYCQGNVLCMLPEFMAKYQILMNSKNP